MGRAYYIYIRLPPFLSSPLLLRAAGRHRTARVCVVTARYLAAGAAAGRRARRWHHHHHLAQYVYINSTKRRHFTKPFPRAWKTIWDGMGDERRANWLPGGLPPQKQRARCCHGWLPWRRLYCQSNRHTTTAGGRGSRRDGGGGIHVTTTVGGVNESVDVYAAYGGIFPVPLPNPLTTFVKTAKALPETPSFSPTSSWNGDLLLLLVSCVRDLHSIYILMVELPQGFSVARHAGIERSRQCV